jgi:hypothetical protein
MCCTSCHVGLLVQVSQQMLSIQLSCSLTQGAGLSAAPTVQGTPNPKSQNTNRRSTHLSSVSFAAKNFGGDGLASDSSATEVLSPGLKVEHGNWSDASLANSLPALEVPGCIPDALLQQVRGFATNGNRCGHTFVDCWCA